MLPALIVPSVRPTGTAFVGLQIGSALQFTFRQNLIGGGFTDYTSGPTWSSSSPAIATVDPTGIVAGLSVGSAVITATLAGATATFTVSVTAQAVPTVDWTKNKVIPVGNSWTAGVGAGAGKGYAARLNSAVTALGGSTAGPFGYSGQTYTYMTSQFDTDVAPVLDITKLNHIFVEAGPNDLCNASGGSVLGDAYINGQLQFIQKVNNKKAAGYPIVLYVLTPPDRNDTTAFNANYRNALPMAQAWLRENYKAIDVDVLVDTAAFYRLGAIGAADIVSGTATAMFGSDKIHPNETPGHYALYKRCLGAMYEYLGITLPTGTAATNLVGYFEPGVAAKGLGTYRPALMPRQAFVTDAIQNPPSGWAHWDDSHKRISFGPLDYPFTNTAGFSATWWVYLSAADVAAANRRLMTCDVTTSSMMGCGLASGAWQFAAFYANNGTNQWDQATAPSALTAGIHTVGVTFDPTKSRGSRITLYVDGSPISSPTLQQAGSDGVIRRPTVIPWSDEVAIGDDQFQPNGPLDYHQLTDVSLHDAPLSAAAMSAVSQSLLARWPASVT